MLGSSEKLFLESEKKAILKLEKSIITTKALKKGHQLELNDLNAKSPGGGLPPYKLESLINKTLKRNLEKEEKILLKDLI